MTLRAVLEEVRSELTAPRQQVLESWLQDRPVSEIAGDVELSERQVRRIQNQIIERLKVRLSDDSSGDAST